MADCDVICNIDLSKVLAQHRESGADLTLVYKRERSKLNRSSDTTVLCFDENGEFLQSYPLLSAGNNPENYRINCLLDIRSDIWFGAWRIMT